MNRACFIDRDGVLIKEKNYLGSPDQVELFPQTAEAIRLLKKNGFITVVVSNQSGVARGYFREKDIAEVEARISSLLAAENVSIDAWYYCCHHPDGIKPEYARHCECRKPAPGMFLRAADDLNIELADSFMIGDKYSDLNAATNAGCRMSVMVMTGHGREELAKNKDKQRPVAVADNILEAVKHIIEN